MSTSIYRLTHFLLLLIALTQNAHAYYGRNAQEAILTFEAPVEVARGLSTAETRQAIDDQIQHLMGTFQSVSFTESFRFPGVLGENYQFKILKKRVGRTADTQTVTYSFSGKVVFKKAAFRNTSKRSVPLKLPLNTEEIYDLGLDENGFNLCTDDHYNDPEDFWYFWDPDMPKCPLRGNDTDVLRIQGQLKALPNTVRTYPEYDQLYGDNGNGETTEISVFLGYIDDMAHVNEPNRKDDAFFALRYLEKDLKDRQFKLVEKEDAFREYSNGSRHAGANFYRVYEKKVRTVTGDSPLIRVKVLLADTDILSTDETFHHFLRRAFLDSDILAYDGHSGLGGNLDLASIDGIQFDPKKYQLFFFNGCSSYPYFNGMFFNEKDGTEKLDILTAGLPTLSYTSGPNIVAFIERFLEGRAVSYQTLLSEMEASNDDAGTYLTGVSGDEDNVFVP